MTTITVTIEVDEALSDPDHDTGLTEEGYERLFEAVLHSVGEIASGPVLV